MQKHLIIFIKNAVLGTVKTRLAKSIGNHAALEVYKDLMHKSRQESLLVNAKRHLYYSEEIEEKDGWSPRFFEKKLQTKGGLGVKISKAFESVFQERGKAIIMGSDCFDLTVDILEEAYDCLDDKDIVIGPANDGGYYLLGMKAFHPELFQNINWSTEMVLLETIEQAKKKNLSVALLQELVDLDTIEDLEQSGYDYKK